MATKNKPSLKRYTLHFHRFILLPLLFIPTLRHQAIKDDSSPQCRNFAAAFPTSPIGYLTIPKEHHYSTSPVALHSPFRDHSRHVFSIRSNVNHGSESSAVSSLVTSQSTRKTRRQPRKETKKKTPRPNIALYGQWKPSGHLTSRNVAGDIEVIINVGGDGNETSAVNLPPHSLLLRSLTQGETPNLKKGRFVNDDERWMYRYEALCMFHERYGHTCVPFRWGEKRNQWMEKLEEKSIEDDFKEETFYDDEDDNNPIDFDFECEEDDGFESELSSQHTKFDENGTGTQISINNERNRTGSGVIMSSECDEPYLSLELGFWVAQQRHYYKQLMQSNSTKGKRLTPQRIEYLDRLNFIWDIKEARWETQYQRLNEYVKRHGHANVRQNSTLGHWVYKQRYHQRNIEKGVTLDWGDIPEHATRPLSEEEIRRKPELAVDRVIDTPSGGKEYRGMPVSPLTPERKAKLNEIGFVWDARESVWDQKFRELIKYKKEFGTTKVPPSHGSLGVWVKKQREAWRALQSTDKPSGFTYALTPDRIAKLDSINFSWQGHDYTWEEHFQHLLLYIERHNTANAPQSLDTDDYPKLGSWLTIQRTEGRKFERNDAACSLSEERYALLKHAGVQFDPKLEQFLSRVEELKAYRLHHGTLKVKSTHDKSLWSWVRRMTKEYEAYLAQLNVEKSKHNLTRKKKLLLEDEIRRRMLDDIGFREEFVNK